MHQGLRFYITIVKKKSFETFSEGSRKRRHSLAMRSFPNYWNKLFILISLHSGPTASNIVDMSVLRCNGKPCHISVASCFLVISMRAVLSLVLELLGLL